MTKTFRTSRRLARLVAFRTLTGTLRRNSNGRTVRNEFVVSALLTLRSILPVQLVRGGRSGAASEKQWQVRAGETVFQPEPLAI